MSHRLTLFTCAVLAARSGDLRRVGARLRLLAFTGMLAACGSSTAPPVVKPDTGLIAFPPMSYGYPPGASAAALATAAALGRGVNFGNMLEAPNEGDWGLRVQPEYIDAAWNTGFRSVRLPVRWSNHAAAGRPFTIDEAFMTRVETVVDQLLGKGFYVVLNMHHYLVLFGESPAGGDVAVDPALLDERFLVMWRQIAQRFANRGDHLVFEPLNEPHGRLTNTAWNELQARVTKVIRQSNPTRVVMLTAADWGGGDALVNLRLPNDSNLIVTIHNYNPFTFTHQGAEWVSPILPTGVTCCTAAQKADLVAPLAKAKTFADTYHYPIYLGEFGAYSKADMDSRVRFTRLMRDEAEARGFTWGYWEFASGFGVYDPVSHTMRTQLRDALLGN